MTIKNIILFCVTFFILKAIYGVYEYWSIRLLYTYTNSHLALIDFCVEEVGSLQWKLRKKLRMKWFNSFRVYRNFTILSTIFLVLISLLLVILYFLIKYSEYAEILTIKW